MKKFELLSLDQTKLVEDLSVIVEVDGKNYEVTVRYINFCDGSCQYNINGKILPVDADTLHAISKAIIDEHFNQLLEDNE